jgi:hypothetical protein
MYFLKIIEDFYLSIFVSRFWKDQGVMAQWVQAPSRYIYVIAQLTIGNELTYSDGASCIIRPPCQILIYMYVNVLVELNFPLDLDRVR